ncbi:hypothetical protein MMC19_002037 [Ptychographa xylographoides]|nr:hypothetical protein [Ptychographa xylographoides]
MPHKGPYSGGYSEVNAARLAAVKIPDKIRCLSCDKLKGPNQFSNKQLSDLRFKILRSGLTPATAKAYIKCRFCTGAQVTELTCIVCDESKSLGEFMKTQRRDPDNARCQDCVVAQTTMLPGIEDIEDDDDSDDSNEYWHGEPSTTTESEGGARLDDDTSDQFNDLRLHHHHSKFSDSTTYGPSRDIIATPSSGSSSIVAQKTRAWADFTKKADQNAVMGDGVWTGQTRGKEVAGKQYTKYDPTGIPHPYVRAPSTVISSTSKWDSPTASSCSEKFPRTVAGHQEEGKVKVAAGEAADLAVRTLGHRDEDGEDDDSNDGYLPSTLI